MKTLLILTCMISGLCFAAAAQSTPAKAPPAGGKASEAWPAWHPDDTGQNPAGDAPPATSKKPSPLAPVVAVGKKVPSAPLTSAVVQDGCPATMPYLDALRESKRIHAGWVALDAKIPSTIPASATSDQYRYLRSLINEALAAKIKELGCFKRYDAGYADEWADVKRNAKRFQLEIGDRKKKAAEMLQAEEAEIADVEKRIQALGDESDDARRLNEILELKRANAGELKRIVGESDTSVSTVQETENYSDHMTAILMADLRAAGIDEDLYRAIYEGYLVIVEHRLVQLKPEPAKLERVRR